MSAPGLLGLVMIVRNEAMLIADVLATYRPYIDAWTILDTGSTDDTPGVVHATLRDVPGALVREPFVDFATSRNRALDLHGTATTFAIMPNGDHLRGGVELRQFLEARRSADDGAYRVRIAPGHYYLPLVTRCGAGWRYRGRTHECASGPRQGSAIPGVALLRERGTRTEAEWKVRWERDLELLRADAADDPTDPRPRFYLGQTLECLGRLEEALEHYQRRAEMGGYFDETFEARLRAARVMDRLGRSWADVQQAYLLAHASDPSRAEPLHAVAEHWYKSVPRSHAVTRIFAAAAADLPKPATDLFLDEEVYAWKAADLASVSSFYTGRPAEGRRYAARAVRGSPHDERLRANLAFCASTATELFGARFLDLDFVPEAGWSVTNPAICDHQGQLRCIARTVNYAVAGSVYTSRAADGAIRTRNFLLDLDDDLRTTTAREMIDTSALPRTDFPVQGFEDARLFAWRGGWWAVATARDFTVEGRCEATLLELGADGAVVHATPLRGPWSSQHQKNWLPLIDGDVARLICGLDHSACLELGATPPRAYGEVPEIGRLRGGSRAVSVPGGWLVIGHEAAGLSDGGRIYTHRFIRLTVEGVAEAATEPFCFELRGIEFCAGLARQGDRLIASYGVDDAHARLAVIDLEAVLGLLRPMAEVVF